jgi:hypothetical protein
MPLLNLHRNYKFVPLGKKLQPIEVLLIPFQLQAYNFLPKGTNL